MCWRTTVWAVALVTAAATAACGEDERTGLCEAGALEAALADADPGDTVQLGACRIEGHFEVPAGVTLAGRGTQDTILVGPDGEVALDVAAGAGLTVVRALGVESTRVGVRLHEAGAARVEDVTVTAARGVALGADGVLSLQVDGVRLRGPMTPDLARRTTSPPTSDDTATFGMALVEVGDAQLTDVELTGFAAWAFLGIDTETTWTGGRVATNLGVGIQVQGGSATLDGVEIVETLQGSLVAPSMAFVAAAGAVADTTGLAIRDGDNFGLVVASASGTHSDLVVQDGGDAAVWLQSVDGVSLAGAEILDNAFAGVIALESTGVELADVDIERTAILTSVGGIQGHLDVGDGIQLVGTDAQVMRATLVGNERVGLIVDLAAGDGSGLTFEDVDVTADGEAYGAVIQNGTATDDWDGGVVRHGDADANDAAFADGDPLPVAEGLEDVPSANPGDVRAVMGPNT